MADFKQAVQDMQEYFQGLLGVLYDMEERRRGLQDQLKFSAQPRVRWEIQEDIAQLDRRIELQECDVHIAHLELLGRMEEARIFKPPAVPVPAGWRSMGTFANRELLTPIGVGYNKDTVIRSGGDTRTA